MRKGGGSSKVVGHDLRTTDDDVSYIIQRESLEKQIESIMNLPDPYITDVETRKSRANIISKINQTLRNLACRENERKIKMLSRNIAYYDAKQRIDSKKTETVDCSNRVSSFFNIGNKDNNQSNDRTNDRTNEPTNEPIDLMNTEQPDTVYDSTVCTTCGDGELVISESDGMMVCRACGNATAMITDSDMGNYKDIPVETSFYAYKRINHFKEILSQFQAKETTQISDNIMTDIKNQVKKERLSVDELTTKKTKEILKKLGYNKYYEHIPFIKDKLGIRPPVMDIELETTLCKLFNELQAPYAKCCPNDRVNFLNYYYTIYKLCELLDQRQFLTYFPMLKDRDKRIEQDAIWKLICIELNWLFIPTE